MPDGGNKPFEMFEIVNSSSPPMLEEALLLRDLSQCLQSVTLVKLRNMDFNHCNIILKSKPNFLSPCKGFLSKITGRIKTH